VSRVGLGSGGSGGGGGGGGGALADTANFHCGEGRREVHVHGIAGLVEERWALLVGLGVHGGSGVVGICVWIGVLVLV
jgi:hypothetical protein